MSRLEYILRIPRVKNQLCYLVLLCRKTESLCMWLLNEHVLVPKSQTLNLYPSQLNFKYCRTLWHVDCMLFCKLPKSKRTDTCLGSCRTLESCHRGVCHTASLSGLVCWSGPTAHPHKPTTPNLINTPILYFPLYS